MGLAGRVDERDHAHRLDGPDKAVPRTAGISRSALAGFCFPPDVIVLAVRWSLRFALSYRDVEELLAERGIAVRQYRRRVRPRPPQVGAATDARAQTRPQRQGCDQRAWFVQNVRRGYYELGVQEPPRRRVAVAFAELAVTI